MHANISFANGFVDVVERSIPMPVELAFGVLHMLSGVMQGFQRMFNPRMGWWNRGRCSYWEGHG
jgi:hypothetical protein